MNPFNSGLDLNSLLHQHLRQCGFHTRSAVRGCLMQVGMKFRILGTAILALLAVAFEGGKARKQGSEMLRAFAFYNGRNIRNPNELVIAESSLRDVASIGPLKFLIFCFGI